MKIAKAGPRQPHGWEMHRADLTSFSAASLLSMEREILLLKHNENSAHWLAVLVHRLGFQLQRFSSDDACR